MQRVNFKKANTVKEIKIYGKLAEGMVALVDDEDYELANSIHWNLQISKMKSSGDFSAYYAIHATRRLLMHRVILGLTDSKKKVDHIDRNGLNNQKENLRVGTQSQNLSNRPKAKKNTTGYKGAYQTRCGRWFSAISFNDKTITLGRFNTAEEAARVYDKAARKQWGEFAYTNFPLEPI